MRGSSHTRVWIAAAMVLVVLAVVSAFLASRFGALDAPQPHGELRSDASPDGAAVGGEGGNGAEPSPAREAGAESSAPAPSSTPAGTLRGRCVAAEDGTPLAGCEIRVSTSPPLLATTGSDGVFALAVAAADFRVEIDGPGRIELHGDWDGAIAAGEVDDLGDVRLARGFPVTGRVVDGAGRGVEGVHLYTIGFAADLRPGQVAIGHSSAVADVDGTFALAPLVPAGTWRIKVTGPGIGVFVDVTVDPFHGAPPLLIPVDPAQGRSMAGHVVTERGAPIAGATVRTDEPPVTTMTGGDGAFLLVAPQSREEGIAMSHLFVESPGHADFGRSQRYLRWGTRDVRLVLRRAAAIEVVVVDDADRPVRAFGLWIGGNPPLDAERSVRDHGSHDGGRVVVRPVRLGRNLLRVFPDDRDLAPSEPIAVEVGDGPMASVRVVLERLHRSEVAVVDAAGLPVAECVLELVRSAAGAPTGWTGDVRGSGVSWLPGRAAERISKSTTDEMGSGGLFVPRDRRGLWLRATKAPYAPFLLADPPLRPDVPLRIVLTAGGSIGGTVDLAGQSKDLHVVLLHHDVAGVPPAAFPEQFELEPGGTYRIEGLVAGTYRVQLGRQIVWRAGNSASWTYVPLDATMRRLVVRAGLHERVDFTAPVVALGVLRGRLRVEGASCEGWEVDLVRVDGSSGRHGSYALAADGSFTADQLLPGSYRLHLRPSDELGAVLTVPLAELVEVAAGSEQAREFAFVARRLELRLRHPDGGPVTDPCELRCGDAAYVSGERVRSGSVLFPVPELPMQVRIHGSGGEWSAPFGMPRDRTEHVVDVVVPLPVR